MPWGVAAAVAGAATSAALAPSSSGGSSGGGSGPNYYVPTGLQTADQQWQALQQGNIDIYNQNPLQQYGQQSLQQGLNAQNQYAPGYQNAANQAGAQYSNLGNTLSNVSGGYFGLSSDVANAGRQAYQTALDPQSALYNRTVQQLQDQTGATNSMYGLGSSAAGAGVANQALSNFNIDWQNQQLQRQLQGLQGFGQAAGQAGQLAGQGATVGGAGAGYTLQGGQLPYQTAQGIAGAPGQLGSAYGQYLQGNVYGPAQGFQTQAIPYMNYGQGAQQVPYQNAYDTSQANAGALSQGIRGLGSNAQVQSALGNVFGGGGATGSFGGGDFSGAFSSNPYYGGGGNSYGFTM